MSGVLTLMSGHPFNINYFFNDDWDGSGEFYGRPDVVGPIVYNHNNPFEFLDLSSFQVPCTLDPTGDGSSVFCIPGTQHFGNLGRNALIGPDYRNVDFAVVKTTSVSERFSLQFRADFFNLTNHTNFANPYLPAFFAPAAPNDFEPRIGTGVDCPVGVVPATGRSCGFLPIVETSDVGLGNPILAGGSPRSIQFAIKLIF